MPDTDVPLRNVRDMTEEERERFFTRGNYFAGASSPGSVRPNLPPPEPPPVSGGEGTIASDTIPAIHTQPLSQREWLENRAETLGRELHPDRKTGWGRVGQVLGTVGQDVGTALYPQVMANIPGTTSNRRIELENVRKMLGEEQQREAVRETEKARTGILQEHEDIERAKAGLPKPLPGAENIFTTTDENGNVTGQSQRFEKPGDPEHPYLVPVTVPGQQPAAGTDIKSVPAGTLPTTPSAPPPPSAAGTLPQTAAPPPTGGQTFLGKPPERTAEQREEQKYMNLRGKQIHGEQLTPEEQRFVDTNAVKYQAKGPIGPEGVSRYGSEVAEIVKGTKVPANQFKFDPMMSHPDALQMLRDARDQADKERTFGQAEHMVDKRQEEKDRVTSGYAVNPQTGNLELTDRYTANSVWHKPFEEMTHAEIAKDRGNIRRLDDVQKNLSEYQSAVNAQRTPVVGGKAMQRIVSGVNDSDVQKMGYITMGAAMDMMEQGEVAAAWRELSPSERAIMIGYLRAKGAMIAYNAVISGSARPAVEQLKVEWQNLPAPYVGATVANDALKSVQENIDIASSGYPKNLPGMPHPEEIRRKAEGAPQVNRLNAPPPGAQVKKFNSQTGRFE